MNRPGGGETRVIEEASRYLLNGSEQQYVVWHPWSRGHMERRVIGKDLESDPGSQQHQATAFCFHFDISSDPCQTPEERLL